MKLISVFVISITSIAGVVADDNHIKGHRYLVSENVKLKREDCSSCHDVTNLRLLGD
jgi:hypothetical protein